jgi:hypothetical protein
VARKFTRAMLASKEKPTHAEFKKTCLDWLKARFGEHFFKLDIAGGPFQKPGSPDTVCSIRGRFYAFEWKVEGDREGPKQIKMAEDIRRAGGKAFFIWSLENLRYAVRDLEPVQPEIWPTSAAEGA